MESLLALGHLVVHLTPLDLAAGDHHGVITTIRCDEGEKFWLSWPIQLFVPTMNSAQDPTSVQVAEKVQLDESVDNAITVASHAQSTPGEKKLDVYAGAAGRML